MVNSIAVHRIRDAALARIRDATTTDDSLPTLGQMIMNGWPDQKDVIPENIIPYFTYRDELTVQDGIIYRSDRVVIPKSLRKDMKEKVHAGHLGVNSCLRRARDLLFWPGMSKEIRQYIETCDICATYGDKQPQEPPIVSEVPSRPWQKVGTDILSYGGHDFLITVDYHSNFFELDLLPDMTSNSVIVRLKSHFARHGTPSSLVSDNGTQYTSANFKRFMEQWGIQHETSSPGNSQSNGAAEAAVKVAKRLMKKAKAGGGDLYIGLLNLRNTQTEGLTTSLAQRLLGRNHNLSVLFL